MSKSLTLPEQNFLTLNKRGYSKIRNAMWSMAVLIAVFIAGCKKDDFKGEISGLCPKVDSSDPMDKAVDVVLNKTISVTFNTDMKASTLNNTTFIIKQGANVISGTIAPGTNSKVFTFKPAVPLLPFTTYTGKISASVTDTLRTAMVADYDWTFITMPQVLVSASPAANGNVAIVNDSRGDGTFAQGSVTTVNATPVTGSVFTNYTENGVVVSTSPSYQFTMAGNKTLVANFAPVPIGRFAVVLSSAPASGGITDGSGSYAAGSTVTATARPNAGYAFVNFTENGNIVSTSSNYQFAIFGNRTLVANYLLIPASQFVLILSSNPVVGGTTAGSGAYNANSTVTATATASTGYNFTSWTNNGNVVSTSATYPFPLTGNTTLVANFALNTYTLNATFGAGGSSVTKNPNQTTYNHGTSVQLTANALSGFTFLSWSGDASGSANPLTVLMNSNKNITANFTAVVVAQPLFSSVFGAFGGNAGITNQGLFTVINNGSIGTTAASTLVTGFHDMTGDKYTETPLNIGNVKDGRIYTDAPPPLIFGPGGPFGGNATTKAFADKGLLDATNFYNSISPANRPGATVQAQELGGLTLAPGTYISASGPFDIINGDLTLDAKGNPNAIWVFQVPSALTVGSTIPRSVKMIGGALSKNVFWYVGSAAVINYAGGGVMEGTIIARAGVTLSSPANSTNTLVQTVLNGRAISLVASVTMVNTVVNVP